MLNIKFTDVTGEVPEQFYPVPGKQSIPQWLKHLEPYLGGRFEPGDNGTTNTAKRCIPMFDAVSSGYIIKLTHDIYVKNENGVPFYRWPVSGTGVEFHNRAQAHTHSSAKNNHDIPKWINPWSIETPSGYSTLFIPPVNGDPSPIVPFSGLVDTDNFFAPTHFPFVLSPGFEGEIPAGTPIAQAIPIKRESWKMEINTNSIEKINKNDASIGSVFRNAYRKMYWNKKSYN